MGQIRHSYETIRMARNIIENSVGKLNITSYFIFEKNDVCPRCREKFKVYGSEIKAAVAVNVYFPADNPVLGVLYCICKKCNKDMEKNRFGKDIASASTEEYIEENLPKINLHPVNITGEKKLKYPDEISARIDDRFSKYKKYDYRLVTNFMDYFNSNCVYCDSEFEIREDNSLSVDGVDIFPEPFTKTAISYCSCGVCKKGLAAFLNGDEKFSGLYARAQQNIYEKIIVRFFGDSYEDTVKLGPKSLY